MPERSGIGVSKTLSVSDWPRRISLQGISGGATQVATQQTVPRECLVVGVIHGVDREFVDEVIPVLERIRWARL